MTIAEKIDIWLPGEYNRSIDDVSGTFVYVLVRSGSLKSVETGRDIRQSALGWRIYGEPGLKAAGHIRSQRARS
ncbi:MAG: hypothetical protein K1W22_03715 [Lachnospiraceae bacterium]